jgi:hypothetical protein
MEVWYPWMELELTIQPNKEITNTNNENLSNDENPNTS